MNRIFSIFLFMIAAVSLQAQEAAPISVDSSKIVDELRIGEEMIFQNTSVKFIKVVADSRCPKNVKCIWAGEAKVLIGIYKNGKKISEEVVTVASHLQQFPALRELGLALNVLGLSPYPDVTDAIQKGEYRLGLYISTIPEN